MKIIDKNSKYGEILSHTFLFKGLDADMVLWTYRSSKCFCARFEPGERVYTRTDFLKCMGIVLSGRLEALKTSSDGSSLILNAFSKGGIFGVAGLFGNHKRYVSEIVAIKQCCVLFLSQSLLHDLFLKAPLTAENYIRFLSNRIYFLNTFLDHFTGGTAEGRLTDFLLSQDLPDERKTFLLPCSMTRLSEILGIGRASLYRAFDELAENGAIRRCGKTVEILNAEKLKNGKHIK